MKRSARVILVVAIVANLALVGIVVFRHKTQKHASAKTELKTVAPELHDRLHREVTRLERESTAESLAKLVDVNLFYWPGPKADPIGFIVKYVPLGKEVGRADLDAISSNRRFCKIAWELSATKKPTVSEMVNRELARSIADYLKMYDAEMWRLAPHYQLDKVAGQSSITGPTFVTGNVQEGKVVIAGARMKILSLVWMCGALGLADCGTNVENVARMAIKQRMELYDEPSLHPFFKAQMLKRASLYNRQIIASALLGIAGDGDAKASVMKEVGLQWSERNLPSYKAALTEFDLPVQSGVMNPDYSLGIKTIKFVTPLDDTQFDQLMKKCGVVP